VDEVERQAGTVLKTSLGLTKSESRGENGQARDALKRQKAEEGRQMVRGGSEDIYY
jgi:hypothetical protein